MIKLPSLTELAIWEYKLRYVFYEGKMKYYEYREDYKSDRKAGQKSGRYLLKMIILEKEIKKLEKELG